MLLCPQHKTPPTPATKADFCQFDRRRVHSQKTVPGSMRLCKKQAKPFDLGRTSLIWVFGHFWLFASWFEEAFIIITDALAWGSPRQPRHKFRRAREAPNNAKKKASSAKIAKNWSNMPSKLHACIGFLYKVVHKIGCLQKLNRAAILFYKLYRLRVILFSHAALTYTQRFQALSWRRCNDWKAKNCTMSLAGEKWWKKAGWNEKKIELCGYLQLRGYGKSGHWVRKAPADQKTGNIGGNSVFWVTVVASW